MSFGTNSKQDEHDMEWAQAVDELQKENEMLHAENALKLTQILDLEQLLYETRVLNMQSGSPCWCCVADGEDDHSPVCNSARKATEPFWKDVQK